MLGPARAAAVRWGRQQHPGGTCTRTGTTSPATGRTAAAVTAKERGTVAAILDTLLAMDPQARRGVLAGLSDEYRAALLQHIQDAEAHPYFQFRGDVLGFVEQGLGEATWSRQREVYRAINEHQKVVVAASHSVGKSHLASRAAGAVATSWPADMVQVQTTATNYRQVKGILWPYIARMHAKYDLPGEVFTTSWKIGREEVGLGFSARNTDETAVSGFHALGELFLIVDEGGGIHRTLGQAFTNVMTGNGHMLVIGNFPTDTDDTWFNDIYNSPEWHTLRISAFDSPNFPRPDGRSLGSLAEVRTWLQRIEDDQTGALGRRVFEQVGRCTVCPATVESHTIAKHLVDLRWVNTVAAEFGEDSGYYTTRVLALPARNITSKTLPISWLEPVFEAGQVLAQVSPAPAPVRLGVDVAVDGGDEFVIAKVVGWHASIVHTSAGAENQNEVDVAGRVLQEIDAAQAYHDQHGIPDRVRVKVDEIGVGRGVSDLLKRWGEERRHNAVIVGVSSSRTAHDSVRFKNQRSEMWWTIRGLIQPKPGEEDGVLLTVDGGDNPLRLLRQLSDPKYATTSTGQIVVQLKSEIKAATGHSPDRADALLLAIYEPPTRESKSAPLILLTQSNPWSSGGGR